MASEWPTMSLRQAHVELIDCDHRTPPPADAGYPYVTIPNLRDGRIDISDARRIIPAHYREWTRRAKPQPNDVVLSRRTNPGVTASVPSDLEFALGQNLVLLRSDGSVVDPAFLRWLVRSSDWWQQIQRHLNVGAVFDSLKCADIPNFRLPIPPLNEQRRIAIFLTALDDKIELNRRMSQTLESMARALFKSWFVDFDPVRAKAEGRGPGVAQHLADLFPASLEESDSGELPSGWRVAAFGDVATSPRRLVNPNEIDQTTPYIGLEHMPRRSIALSEWGEAESVGSGKTAFRTGEILFGKLRPYFHKVGVAPTDGVCSTDIVVVAPKGAAWFGFVLGHASSDQFVDYTIATSSGTKMPRTSWSDMARFPVVEPPAVIAAAFTDQIRPAVDRMILSIHEMRTLAIVRDSLLPSLTSGRLQLPQIESQQRGA